MPPDFYYEWAAATYDERERGSKDVGPEQLGHSTFCGDTSLFGTFPYTLVKDWQGEFCEISGANRLRPILPPFETSWDTRKRMA